jgi:hypothetical protein
MRFELREAFFECVVDGRVGVAAEGDPQRGRVLFDAVDHRLAIWRGHPTREVRDLPRPRPNRASGPCSNVFCIRVRSALHH